MLKPKITVLQKDFYCEQTKIEDPYDLKTLAGITAIDGTGKDISESINIDSSKVNYQKVGDYLVNVTAMDAEFNMTVSNFIVHVVPATKPKSKKDRITNSFKFLDKFKGIPFKQKLSLLFITMGVILIIAGAVITYFDMFG